MTRRLILLAILGAGVTGCGGGASESNSIRPWIELAWSGRTEETRASALSPTITLPVGTQSVVLTFEGASGRSPGSDVVIQVNRPDSHDIYSQLKVTGTEPVLRKDARVRVDAYLGPNATGRLFRRGTVLCQFVVHEWAKDLGAFHPTETRFDVVREKVTGVQISADSSQMTMGTTQALKIALSYPTGAHELAPPIPGEIKLNREGIYYQSPSGNGYAAEVKYKTPENFDSLVPADSYGMPQYEIVAQRPGKVSISIEIDGVKSNTLEIDVASAT